MPKSWLMYMVLSMSWDFYHMDDSCFLLDILQGQLKLGTLITILVHWLWSLQKTIWKKFMMLCPLVKLVDNENMTCFLNMFGSLQIPHQSNCKLWTMKWILLCKCSFFVFLLYCFFWNNDWYDERRNLLQRIVDEWWTNYVRIIIVMLKSWCVLVGKFPICFLI